MSETSFVLIPMNREEWLDLAHFFIRREVLQNRRVALFSPHAIYGVAPFVSDTELPQGVALFAGVNPFRSPFYELDKTRKGILAALNALRLEHICRRIGARVLISGIPSAYIRLARSLSRRPLAHIAYLRSVYPGFGALWSDSDWLSSSLKGIGLRTPSWLDSYSADRFLVAGQATTRMLMERGVARQRAQVVGPGHLSRFKTGDVERTHAQRLVYVTQAFLRHHDTEGNACQRRCLRALTQAMAGSGDIDFVVRPHPRDDRTAWEDILASSDHPVRVDDSPAYEFLMNEDRGSTALVGATSTLLFEWAWLGGRSYLFADAEFSETYGAFFEQLGVSPYTNPLGLVEAVRRGDGHLDERAVSTVLAMPGHSDLSLTPQAAIEMLDLSGPVGKSVDT